MNLSIYGNTIKSLMQDRKEIVKIEKVEDGKILYEKKENDLLFYDDASIDKSSEYTATLPKASTYGYITHNTDYYSINGGNAVNSFNLENIGQLTNCEIEITVKPTSTSFSGALGISFSTGNQNASGFICYSNGSTRKVLYQNNSWVESYHKMYYGVTTQEGDYFTYKLIKQGNTITIPAINQSYTIPWTNCYIGIMCGSGVNAFKELKIKTFHSYDLSVTASEDAISSGVTMSLTATLTDNNVPVTGKRLSYQIKHDNMVISSGSDTTDNNGQIPIHYTGTGIGDVDIIISYGNLVQKTYKIEDCYYYNDGSRVSDLEIDSGVSCTTNGNYITITTNINGEKYVRVPVAVSGNWEFSSEIASIGYFQHITFIFNNNSYWGSINNSAVVINLNDSITQYSHTPSVGDIFKIKYVNGVLSTYINDTQLKTKTVSLSNIKYGFYTNNGRIQHLRNIKVKAL